MAVAIEDLGGRIAVPTWWSIRRTNRLSEIIWGWARATKQKWEEIGDALWA